MKRSKRTHAARDSDSVIDVSSLIDICFLLLIYFIVTSIIVPRESDLGLGLPGPPDGKLTRVDPMAIAIDAAGVISCGDGISLQQLDSDPKVRELLLLQARLELYKSGVQASGDTPVVSIHADNQATQQRVIDVLNALAGVGIKAVTFQDLEATTED